MVQRSHSCIAQVYFKRWNGSCLPLDEKSDVKPTSPRSVNGAVGGAYNAVRLSSASLIERAVCNGRTTVRRPLTDAPVSNQRAHESHAYWRVMHGFGRGKFRSVEQTLGAGLGRRDKSAAVGRAHVVGEVWIFELPQNRLAIHFAKDRKSFNDPSAIRPVSC
jgi:hypothetical protein